MRKGNAAVLQALILCSLLLVGLCAHASVTLFYEAYTSEYETQNSYKYYGPYAIRLNNSDNICWDMSTADYTGIVVEYARKTVYGGVNPYFVVEWWDGYNWHILEDTSGSHDWKFQRFYLPSSADNNPYLCLRFETWDSTATDYAYVDEVKIAAADGPSSYIYAPDYHYYVDLDEDDSGHSAIWQYTQFGWPRAGEDQSAAVFHTFSDDTPPKHHLMAQGSDGYLYFDSYNDTNTNYSGKVRRLKPDGTLDANWSVTIATDHRLGHMRFDPDGDLYVVENNGAWSKVWYIDIANQTKTEVLLAYYELGDISFYKDLYNVVNAYVSNADEGVGEVYHYTVSNRTWTEDGNYLVQVPQVYVPYVGYRTKAYGLASAWDGYLYVNNGYGTAFRYNAGAGRDTSWSPLVDLHTDSNPQASFGMDFGPDGALYIAAAHETVAWDQPAGTTRCTTASTPQLTNFTEVIPSVDGTQTDVILDVCWGVYTDLLYEGFAWEYETQNSYKYYGAYAAQLNNSDSLRWEVSTAGHSGITVQYARKLLNCDGSDHFIAEWSDGSSWHNLEDVTGSSDWTVKTFNLPSGADDNPGFMLRVLLSGNGAQNYVYLDEVYVVAAQ